MVLRCEKVTFRSFVPSPNDYEYPISFSVSKVFVVYGVATCTAMRGAKHNASSDNVVFFCRECW